ncbi:MAG: GNAT family N-acetyltransferase [Rothia sp. (in: high G+C Gram-positive bacteria)]|nr:GNAT family N-acetyltransferase [Rothia sp. (in: high G+C Gram-positive bacteria)]
MDFEVRAPRASEALAWEKLRLVSWRKAYAADFAASIFAKQEAQAPARAAGFAEWLAATGDTGQDVQEQLGQTRKALVAVRKDGGTSVDMPEVGSLLGLAYTTCMPYETQRLEMLYLLPEAFGTGVAHALLTGALEPGKAKLEVLTTNTRAIRFYEKEGFEIAGTDEFAGYKTYIMRRS